MIKPLFQSADTLAVVQDMREKALMKVARRGVVRLFNAVSKAQKQQLEESVVGKRAKVSSMPWHCI